MPPAQQQQQYQSRGGSDFGVPSSSEIVSNSAELRSKQIQVEVPKGAVGSVIGRGGETIKRIQAETQARVNFDQGDQGRDVRICYISGL